MSSRQELADSGSTWSRMIRRRALESPGAVAPTHENQDARKPSFTPLVVFSVALLLISGAVATGFLLSAGGPPQPHIVFILADDLGWNDVSYNGCPQIRTPNIDALAWNGVRLGRYYTQALCTPSRAALMTGRYPIHTGMQHSIIFNEEPRGLSLRFQLLPQWLAERGYTTHMIGKWHLGFHKTEYTPTKRGFHRHVGLWGAYVDYFTHEKTYRGGSGTQQKIYNVTSNPIAYRATSGSTVVDAPCKRVGASLVHHPVYFHYSVLKSSAHPPYHPVSFHHPLFYLQRLSPDLWDACSLHKCLLPGMVSALDESVGSVFESLNRRGMLDNTVFVFSSDNGADTDSDNANSASSWPFKGQKYTPWEGGVRAPAVIWSPLFPRLLGSVYNNLFHISDWLPTLYQLAGGPAEGMADDIDGLSHLDSLTAGTDSPRHELLINIDPVENYSAIIEGHFKLVKGRASGSAFDKWYSIPGNVTWDSDTPRKQCESSVVVRVLRNIGLSPVCGAGGTSYAVPVDCGQRDLREKSCAPERSACLFDLSKDPCEYNDVSGQYPEVRDSRVE
ncbi:unnamed protein product, partial [Ixodes persulcatus]